jgi:hypothetical protein
MISGLIIRVVSLSVLSPFGCLTTLIGTWRSLVARLLGVQEAVGSNPAVPTIFLNSLARLPFPFSTAFGRFVGRFQVRNSYLFTFIQP